MKIFLFRFLKFLAILVWIFFSFYISSWVVKWSIILLNGRFAKDWDFFIDNAEAIAALFVGIFAILAGIGSILISYYFFRKTLEVSSYIMPVPVSIEDYFLKNEYNGFLNNTDFNDNAFIQRGKHIFNFTVINKMYNQKTLAFDLSEQKLNAPLFCIINKGGGIVKIEKMVVCPFENDGANKYNFKTGKNCMKEDLEDSPPLLPGGHFFILRGRKQFYEYFDLKEEIEPDHPNIRYNTRYCVRLTSYSEVLDNRVVEHFEIICKCKKIDGKNLSYIDFISKISDSTKKRIIVE